MSPTDALRASITALFAASLLAATAFAQPAPDDAAFEKKLAAVSAAEEFNLLLARSQELASVDTARAIQFAERARKAATRPHDELMADVRIATLRRQRGEHTEAHATARAALARAAELGDEPARAELLLAFARTNWSLGDYPAAMAAHQELLALATKLGNRQLVARGHLGLSVVYGEMKDRTRARSEEEIALAIARELGDRETESDALNNLGNNFLHGGDLARAREMHEQSLAIRADIGNRRSVGDSHLNLAEVATAARDFPNALDHATQALALYEKIGLPRYVASASSVWPLSRRMAASWRWALAT
jgi:tetratricopeptide (TPR) repeat protein